jgi:ribonuclease HI
MATTNRRPRSVIEQLGISMQGTIIKPGLLGILQAGAVQAGAVHTQDTERLVVFTDGACSNNGSSRARAGYGVVWPHNRALDVSKRLLGQEQTNNRAEFSALIEAQRIADTIDPSQERPLHVYTDSELLINSVTKWLPGWKRNGWRKSDRKPVLNQDLLREIDSNPRPLVFNHVRAHTGRRDWESIHNEEADRLARDALRM